MTTPPTATSLRNGVGYLPTPPCTERQPSRSYPIPADLRAQLVEHVVVPERRLVVVGQRFAVAALRLGMGELRDLDPVAYGNITELRMFRYTQRVRTGRCCGEVSTHAWGLAVDVVVEPAHLGAVRAALARHGFVPTDGDGPCDHPHFVLSEDAITFGRYLDEIQPF